WRGGGGAAVRRHDAGQLRVRDGAQVPALLLRARARRLGAGAHRTRRRRAGSCREGWPQHVVVRAGPGREASDPRHRVRARQQPLPVHAAERHAAVPEDLRRHAAHHHQR
ncbi:hypothetical protein AAVH_35286, partial [Aphelenchoides avenae]